MNILITTADLIMGSTDVNAGGTQVATGNDHGSGNAWEDGCARTASGAWTIIIT